VNKKVYIVIANYTRGWKHTLECLESVFRNSYGNFQIIVVDDFSKDNGLLKIKKWADGEETIIISDKNPLKHLSWPPVQKKIKYIEFEDSHFPALNEVSSESLILIQSSFNRGYAGASNLGLRYALKKNDFEYVWLLNNDTVIMPDALKHLVQRMEEKSRAGMCGSTFLYYHNADLIQTLGGARFNKLTGIGKQIGANTLFSKPVDVQKIEAAMDYVYGSSKLVSQRFLKETGLMNEDYFVYFEELDWRMRSKEKFSLAYAPDSIVYHKAGTTIGGGYRSGEKSSLFSDYYYIKNMLRFTSRFHPWALPFVYLRLILMLLQKLKGRQWSNAKLLFKIMFCIPIDLAQIKNDLHGNL
jgi:GT2 family glycosyltransferase